MKSETLEFQLPYQFKTFLVSYESYSRERNLLMSIQFEDLPIDTVELRTVNPGLYREVVNAMKNNAASYWDEQDEEQVKKVPTLARQTHPSFNSDELMKSIFPNLK